MKKFYGTGTYVQSVGVLNDLEIDGFAIATCEEIYPLPVNDAHWN